MMVACAASTCVESMNGGSDDRTGLSTTGDSRADSDRRPRPGPSVRLDQLSIAVLEPYLIGLGDTEIGRLTGSRRTFTREAVAVAAHPSRAQRAYEEAGFTVEGRRRDVLRWDGAWHDDLVMAALNPASA